MSDVDTRFDRSQSRDGWSLAVTGEVDLSVAGRFAQELARLVAEPDPTGRVDLSAVGFMDSSGIRELLKAKRDAEAKGGVLILVRPSAACRRVLEISGVWSEFTVRSS